MPPSHSIPETGCTASSNEAASHEDLRQTLNLADLAMKVDDIEAASAAMAKGAEICLRLQAAGLSVPADEAEPLRELARRCGSALAELSRRLNARSFRDDQHRRAILSYSDAPKR